MSVASSGEKLYFNGIEKIRFLYLSIRAAQALSSPRRQPRTRRLSDHPRVSLWRTGSGLGSFRLAVAILMDIDSLDVRTLNLQAAEQPQQILPCRQIEIRQHSRPTSTIWAAGPVTAQSPGGRSAQGNHHCDDFSSTPYIIKYSAFCMTQYRIYRRHSRGWTNRFSLARSQTRPKISFREHNETLQRVPTTGIGLSSNSSVGTREWSGGANQ